MMHYISDLNSIEEGSDLRVRWEVSDGYVGKSRPNYTEVPWSDVEYLLRDWFDVLYNEFSEEIQEEADKVVTYDSVLEWLRYALSKDPGVDIGDLLTELDELLEGMVSEDYAQRISFEIMGVE